MNESYQTYLPVAGVDPAEDELSEDQLKFLKELDKAGIRELRVGFATEADESNVRHVSADISIDGELHHHISTHCHEWPDGLNMDTYDLWTLLNDHCDSMVHIYPGRKLIESGVELYVTEPELQDTNGNEVDWNYHN